METAITHFAAEESHFKTQSLSDDMKNEAYSRERSKWIEAKAMEIIPISSMPQGSNLIGSHVDYRI